jgi:transposase
MASSATASLASSAPTGSRPTTASSRSGGRCAGRIYVVTSPSTLTSGLGSQETFGFDGLEVTWNVFHAWKQFQLDGDRAALQQRVEVIKQQMRPLLEWGSTGKRQRHVRALAKNLLKLWPALWTFADVDDVEPTNNAAERGLRAAVIYRKLSLGSRSQGGERMIERLLSVDQTCRLQRRSLYAYLADALTAKARGDPVPSLMEA